MKTLGEFIQRLQNDAAFEKKAQAFDNGDELMAFVKSEGYDFTLEELTSEFKRGAELPNEADGMGPVPTDVSASTPPRPDVTAFPRRPAAFPHGEKSAASPKNGSADFPREQSRQGLQKLPGEIPPKDPEEKSTGGLPRVGGGRHRGFSPQRLKGVSGEDS
jgi:predicted ribosomally synthesized peptide with nif11-like leader